MQRVDKKLFSLYAKKRTMFQLLKKHIRKKEIHINTLLPHIHYHHQLKHFGIVDTQSINHSDYFQPQ